MTAARNILRLTSPSYHSQLRVFHSSCASTEAVDAMNTAQPEIRELFSEVRTIMRLLLLLPLLLQSWSCETERSFLALRRLEDVSAQLSDAETSK